MQAGTAAEILVCVNTRLREAPQSCFLDTFILCKAERGSACKSDAAWAILSRLVPATPQSILQAERTSWKATKTLPRCCRDFCRAQPRAGDSSSVGAKGGTNTQTRIPTCAGARARCARHTKEKPSAHICLVLCLQSSVLALYKGLSLLRGGCRAVNAAG